MKLMAGVTKDERITSTLTALEAFIFIMTDIFSVFHGDYDGGDFCSGLIFGKDGSKMML